ncbi:AAA family ATPase [Paraburkholderia tropica]|uniref:AAA family ATPase n=1 Tax=Paraburkholderia tropica TaxID=92647 RepID=UPI001590B966|nr:AAA family ATPase [Paraburkholderia tropica]
MNLKSDDMSFLTQDQRNHLAFVRESWTLMYGLYETWYEEMMDYVSVDEPGQLVLLIGPTHVGKTALMKFLERILAKRATDLGMPILGSSYIRIPAASNSKFDKGETYRRLIQALQPELPQKYVAYGDPRSGAIKPTDMRRMTHAGMLQAVVNRMRDGYSALFLDEVGELPLLLKTNAMIEAAMAIKEIADLAQRTAFLAGGPEVAPLLWQNAQLTARLQTIWIRPLNIRNKNEVAQFIGFFSGIVHELGPDYIDPEIVSVSNGRYIMMKTWGTIGLASKEIIRAVARSLRRLGKPLQWEMLKECFDRCHERLRYEMAFEIKMFEAAQDPDRRSDYWALASKLNMRSTLDGRIKERNRGYSSEKAGEEGKATTRNNAQKSNVKKGTARPEQPERTPMDAVPEVDEV